jgi:hypothetical protein
MVVAVLSVLVIGLFSAVGDATYGGGGTRQLVRWSRSETELLRVSARLG